MITLHINGEHRAFEHQVNVAELLEELKLAGKKLAIERNGELIPRSQYVHCQVVDGDRFEIVVAIGGG